MARTAQITDGGSRTVNLINTGATGFIPIKGGFGRTIFSPHQLDAARQLDDIISMERWTLHGKGSSVDNLASQQDDLIELLRAAYLYHANDPTERKPIYLQEQLTGESNARYAMVFASPEIANPDLFGGDAEIEYLIQNLGVSIARGPWESAPPGSAGSAITLTASDGPADPDFVHIANFRDDINITHIYNYDASIPAFSGNLFGTAPHPIFPSAGAAVGDYFYVGGDETFKHFFGYIGIAGVYTGVTFQWEYWNGSAWTALIFGTDFTLYPDADPLDVIGHWGFSWLPKSDWAKTTINTENKYWIRCAITAVGTWTTTPQNYTIPIYVQRSPYIEIPSTVLKGNTRARIRFRMDSSYGGDENEGFANNSLIIAGARSIGLGANQFTPRLNAGNQDNPTGVTVTAGTDASFVADPQAPGGYHCLVDFSGDETLVNRCRFTLANKLEYYKGKFRAFLICQQTGGAAGDIEIMLRMSIGSTDAYAPHFDTYEIPTEGADQGHELLELSIKNPGGTLKIPLGQTVDSDDLSNVNLYFEIHAKRTTGSGQLIIYELDLCPVDDWTAEYPDPLSDTVSGSSALRGNTGLEDDAGVIDDRTFKYINAQTAPVIGETWTRGGKPPTLHPATQYRIYFWFGHFPAGGTWGTGPIIASPGMHMTFEMYAHNLYYALRGSG